MKRHNYKIQGVGGNLISFAVMACSAFLVGAAYAAYLVPTNGSRLRSSYRGTMPSGFRPAC